VATGATEFWRVGVLGIWRTLPILLVLAVPFVLLCFIGRKHTPDKLMNWKRLLGMLLLSALLYATALLTVFFSSGGILSPWGIYCTKSNPELCLSNFGVLTSFRLDMKHVIFPPKEQDSEEVVSELDSPNLEQDQKSTQWSDQSMDIDFAGLAQQESDEGIKAMHAYFGGQVPSKQNQYTGMFAGKNLIMITAEAFSTWAVDKDLTPTLYRLSREGFVFRNFYTPLWWVSTSDGEYVSCTSLIPKSGKQSFGASATNDLYFCMGNQLKRQGYDTRAYHDHTYTYYKRDKTHPNMGYLYKGLGNGLEVAPTWPESDVEMMQQTVPEYMNRAPFHVYYMTVSGHLEYSFTGNQMAAKNRDKVSQLQISEESQAYLACQIELDKALESLLQQLQKAGQLENTVICLYPDHYPYGLSEKAIDELAGPGVRETLDLYRNTMILWSGDQKEPIVIDKPCSNLDILPTLSNLFGLKYDSRLLMGRDILSDDPGLVIFSDCSYITELGEYHAKDDTFTPAPNAVVPDGYPQKILKHVQDKFLYSGKLLMTDYYRKLGLESAIGS
jgi:phosphoglycerol transferase MdoB-like AlkP superfamily enzyme